MNTGLETTPAVGVVCRREVSVFLVWWEGKNITCRLALDRVIHKGAAGHKNSAGRRAGKSLKAGCAEAAPVVGDRVSIEQIDSGTGWITEILPRRSRIARRSSDTLGAQILAANIDQVFAFCTLGTTEPEWHLLDRFLALSEIESIPAAIILSKADLLQPSSRLADAVETEIGEFRRIGYPVILCSARTGLGMAEVRVLLRDRTTLLLGKSGAGKTSLLNALCPDGRVRTAETNRFGEGRCTTSGAELHPIGADAIVDTPGLRKLGLWDAEDLNPASGFREMKPFIGACRFGADCRHTEEPGCALRRGVEAGRIGVRRFRSMLHLAEDQS
jgi:ribosome biogenesis GTPase